MSMPVSAFATKGRSTRCVHFNELVGICDIANSNEYSPNERKATWYCAHELQKIRNDIRELVHLLELNYPLDEKTACRRGLEHLTIETSSKRRYHKDCSLYVVLDMQSEGIYPAKEVAKEYAKAAFFCCRTALETGVLDANYVSAIQKTDNALRNRFFGFLLK